jgi:hypothetical protein
VARKDKYKTSGLYTTLDVCSILYIPRERLRDWMVRKYVIPFSYHKPGRGKGIAIFSVPYVYKVFLFKILVEYGYTREYAHKLITIPITDLTTKQELILNADGAPFARSIINWQVMRSIVDELIEIYNKKGRR